MTMTGFNSQNLFLITGASRGLGCGIVQALVASGARVIGLARNEDALLSLQASLTSPEQFIPVVQDLTQNYAELPSLLKQLTQTHGPLQGMVHAAGMSQLVPIQGIQFDRVNELFTLNTFVAMALAKGFLSKQVTHSTASMVCLSSIATQLGFKGLSAYSASKGALEGMLKSVALEFSARQLRINALKIGHIATDLTQQFNEVYSESYTQEANDYPLGTGTIQDVANMTLFLLSDKSKWLTGQSITLDGGRSLL